MYGMVRCEGLNGAASTLQGKMYRSLPARLSTVHSRVHCRVLCRGKCPEARAKRAAMCARMYGGAAGPLTGRQVPMKRRGYRGVGCRVDGAGLKRRGSVTFGRPLQTLAQAGARPPRHGGGRSGLRAHRGGMYFVPCHRLGEPASREVVRGAAAVFVGAQGARPCYKKEKRETLYLHVGRGSLTRRRRSEEHGSPTCCVGGGAENRTPVHESPLIGISRLSRWFDLGRVARSDTLAASQPVRS